MSHSSMLKARRERQRNKKKLEGAVKKAERLVKEALKGPVVKKEKVKRVKKEKVVAADAGTAKVEKKPKAPKPTEGGGPPPAKKKPAAGGKK